MMSILKDQVRKFYEIIWNAYDERAIPSVLHENFTFRGSLGQERRGYDGFAEYVGMVHKALGDYRCVIEELIEEGEKVFAKMTFTGIHQDDFLGYRPTHKRVSWAGCALFGFDGEKVSDIWVLGDLKALEEQLKRNST
jgi:predicted ester cyclase